VRRGVRCEVEGGKELEARGRLGENLYLEMKNSACSDLQWGFVEFSYCSFRLVI
jgi:hypothetical protein